MPSTAENLLRIESQIDQAKQELQKLSGQEVEIFSQLEEKFSVENEEQLRSLLQKQKKELEKAMKLRNNAVEQLRTAFEKAK